jgi:hypothetical protein
MPPIAAHSSGRFSKKTLAEKCAGAITATSLIDTPPAQIGGSEERDTSLKASGQEMSFKGQPYLLGYAMPNFHFHLVTAYNILRHNGVVIGKRDYIGMP